MGYNMEWDKGALGDERRGEKIVDTNRLFVVVVVMITAVRYTYNHSFPLGLANNELKSRKTTAMRVFSMKAKKYKIYNSGSK
jgi:hypothetical protein